ncbi:DUF5063 domain-containing protein [Gephyromycinifex aptenodytis]|uniref:DUF5063 domain-containing protein n=1 Tax=Gephyromycinifex aptenodytis TaxID=2716227 RepID=UPI0014481494|nr:DUF5063 domain-containing protein [Gephyromycinifex aptenodytis]
MPENQDSEKLASDLEVLGKETATEARAFLTIVRQVAEGVSPDNAIPLLLLAVSQVLVTGTRLGAITDIVPARQFEPDLGSDEDVEALRVQLAQLLHGLDDYVEVVDPLTTTEVSAGQISGDLAEIASSLMHGLRHHAEGEISEALWWWQFSYLSSWGARAASALRALQSILMHIRLDADEDTVAEAQFDALHR